MLLKLNNCKLPNKNFQPAYTHTHAPMLRIEKIPKVLPTFQVETTLDNIAIGIDEVGRGALAGPVMAVALYFCAAPSVIGINDSKKLSPKQRQDLYAEIIPQAVYAIGSSSVQEIDQMGIVHATHLAMQRAANQLNLQDKYILVDGNTNPFSKDSFSARVKTIVRGDQLYLSIAAASIIAKVTRDRLMDALSLNHPQYFWERNKGYSTSTHMTAIRQCGITKHHRAYFLRSIMKSS